VPVPPAWDFLVLCVCLNLGVWASFALTMLQEGRKGVGYHMIFEDASVSNRYGVS